MKSSKKAALACLASLLMAGTALAAPLDDLSGLSRREYEDYVRERFEWLTGEARSGRRLETKANRDCKPGAPDNSPAGRACEVAKAAAEQSRRILQEGDDLLHGLEQRLGTVPAWARVANGQLVAVSGRTLK